MRGRADRVTGAGRSGASSGSRAAMPGNDGGFLHLEGGSYSTLSETVGGALRGAKARATVTASRDDVFEDISQADARNGNRERDGFRSTQGIARLTLAPTRSAGPRKLGPLPAISRGDRRPRPPARGPNRLRGRPRVLLLARRPGWPRRRRAGTSCRAGSPACSSATPATARDGGPSIIPFGFDKRLLLGRWTNTQSVYRGTP